MQILTFLQRYCWRFRSSGLLHCVYWKTVTFQKTVVLPSSEPGSPKRIDMWKVWVHFVNIKDRGVEEEDITLHPVTSVSIYSLTRYLNCPNFSPDHWTQNQGHDQCMSLPLPSSSIFMQYTHILLCGYYSWTAWPWRWRHYDPSKCWQLFTCQLPQTSNMLIDFLSFILCTKFMKSDLIGPVTYIIFYFQNLYKEMSTHFSKHVSCSIHSQIIDIYLKNSQNGWYFEGNTRRKSLVCMLCIICSVQ